LEGHDPGVGQTHIINYHKAKGREFDFTVMVVEPRGESKKTPLDEQRRLYYVCATRAKEMLFVIYYGKELGRILGPVLKPTIRPF
jgi:superfamily I DNA/RNA helicase